MREIIDKQKCSGCHACFNICPKQSITMVADPEGFLYPQIDSEKCIDCGLCKKACPILKDYSGNKGMAYACMNKNEEIRMESSSGGVFTLIAELVIDRGGVVFGAAFDDELNVCHLEIKDKLGLERLRGSKYLQSTIGESYKSAKRYLEDGKTVLFSGTPCQISGLKAFLDKEYENLITQDIICHGVPSPAIWQKYLKYLSLTRNKKINKEKKPKFREKFQGWYGYSLSVFFEDEIFRQRSGDNLYMKAFLSNLCLRQSCYTCQSKSLERESDITLADFWGIDKILPDMFDNKGTSLVIVNTKKGQRLFDEVSDKMVYKSVDIDVAVKDNPSAYKSCEKNKKRNSFMAEITAQNFDCIVEKYVKKTSVLNRGLNKLKKILKRSRKNV